MYSDFTIVLTFQALNMVQDFVFYFLFWLLYLISFYFVNIALLLFDGEKKKEKGVGLES